MTRKDFVTKFLEIASVDKRGNTPCYMMLYKYPSGSFSLSFEAYHTNQTFVRVHGKNLSRMFTDVIRQRDAYERRYEMGELLMDKECLPRPSDYLMTPEEIGIVSKAIRKKRNKKIVKK